MGRVVRMMAKGFLLCKKIKLWKTTIYQFTMTTI